MSAFELLPYENLVPGVRYREGRLRLRPTWAATLAGAYGAAIGVLVGIVGVATRSVVPLSAGIALSLISSTHFRSRLVAEGSEIVVVSKWRRRRVLHVDSVREVRLESFRPTSFIPFRGPLTAWPRTLEVGVLILDTESLRCDALVGLPAAEGDEIPTAAETKVAILQRWLSVHHL